MEKKLLLLSTMAFAAMAANAGEWVQPTVRTSDPISGDSVAIYNVEGKGFLNQGEPWGTHTHIAPTAVTFVVTNVEGDTPATTGWTILTASGAKAGKYVFRADETGCYVDMAEQGHNFWDIYKTAEGYYRIRLIADDAVYGKGVRAEGEEGTETYYDPWEHETLGWLGGENTQVTANVDPSNEECGVNWQFVTLADYHYYEAQLALFATLEKAESLGLSTAEAEKVYNDPDATLEAIQAANAALKGDIIRGGASEENPIDVTEYLVNPSFDASTDGWDIDMPENHAGGGGYQTASYTNGEVTISRFIECWTWAQGPNEGLRNGHIQQVVNDLPAGKYSLEVDCIAVNQAGNEHQGVQLFAKGGDIDNYIEIATENNKPLHFTVQFVSSGGDVTLGLRTIETCANWIAADNFRLFYMGEVADPHKYALDQVIAQCEATYPDLEEVHADATVIAAYSEALEAAKGATEDYDTAKTQLSEAANALAQSVDQYKSANEKLGDLDKKIAEIETNAEWMDLANDLADLYDTTIAKYETGELTAEDIAAFDGQISQVISDFISENCKAGDDVTLLLSNPNFDKNFKGWQTTGAGVVWSNWDAQGANNAEAAAKLEQPVGGLAERWHATFTMSQTIYNMPRGMYTLTCQGFNRHDDGVNDKFAELYAILPDGSEQSVPFCDIDEYATEEKLYDNGEWSSDADRGGLWAPNSMSGSAWHFMNKKDGEHYDYVNQFNIIMAEQGDLTVGARCTDDHQWVIFDNFRIIYQGSSAAIYQPEIERLSNLANTLGDGGLLTIEAAEKIDAAVAAGADAIAGGSEDDCIQAISDLKEAIELGESALKLTAELLREYEMYSDYLMEEVISSDERFPAYLDELAAAIDEASFADNAAVEAYIEGIKAGFTAYVQYDYLGATEEEPGDISGVIYNRNAVDPITMEAATTGWTALGNAASDGVAFEQFNNAESDFHQTIYGLAPGYYRLKVQGFYRAGYPDAVAATINEGNTPARNICFYAGETSTTLNSIMEGIDTYNANMTEGAKVTIDGQEMFLPNSMAQFDSSLELIGADGETLLWDNILQFQVTEEQKSVEVGLKRTAHIDGDWLIFTNWRLEYIGTAEPTTDPTTAVRGVETSVPASTTFYSLDGTRRNGLTRGINIVKVTQADGSVRISKVLVR